MKKIRRKLTMVIATAMLAITMMTAMTTIKASAATPDWITEITNPLKRKSRRIQSLQSRSSTKMMYLDQQRYLKENYNMNMDQLTTVVYDIKEYRSMGNEDQNSIIDMVRHGMRREERFGCTPSWTEDMIRFAIDFWDQLDKFDIQVIKLWK